MYCGATSEHVWQISYFIEPHVKIFIEMPIHTIGISFKNGVPY